MPILLRPSGDTDFANAVTHPDGTSPHTIDGLAAGTYQIGRLVWAAGPVTVTDVPVATTSFAVTGTGPYFVDPANIPAGTTRIRYRFRMRVPSTALESSIERLIASVESDSFNVSLFNSGGSVEIRIGQVETAGGTNITPASRLVAAIAKDSWVDVDIHADQAASQVAFSVNGGAPVTRAFSGPGDVFPSNREISFLANTGATNNSALRQGVEFEFIEAYFTTNGTETLRKRIAGNAATVNADPWKKGTDAV